MTKTEKQTATKRVEQTATKTEKQTATKTGKQTVIKTEKQIKKVQMMALQIKIMPLRIKNIHTHPATGKKHPAGKAMSVRLS